MDKENEGAEDPKEEPKEGKPEGAKGEELKKREEELDEREADLRKREADLNGLGEKIRNEYERKIEQQREEFAKRLKDREEIIKQLSSESEDKPRPTLLEKLNEERARQNKKW